jgi:hypothetical protein
MSNINRQKLARIFEGREWMSIGDLFQAALAEGVFSPGHFAKCQVSHSKAALRRVLRSGRLRLPDGTPIRLVSITMIPEGTRKRVRVYKREDMLTIEDYWQLMACWDRQVQHARKMKRHYIELATQAHGSNFVKLLPRFAERELV